MTNNVIREFSLTVKFIYCICVSTELNDNIKSITVIIDFISKTTFAHFINFVNLRPIISQNLVETLNQTCLSFFFNVWADDIHDFVFSHPLHLLLVLAAPFINWIIRVTIKLDTFAFCVSSSSDQRLAYLPSPPCDKSTSVRLHSLCFLYLVRRYGQLKPMLCASTLTHPAWRGAVRTSLNGLFRFSMEQGVIFFNYSQRRLIIPNLLLKIGR